MLCRLFGLPLQAFWRSKNRNHMAKGVRQPEECWQPLLKEHQRVFRKLETPKQRIYHTIKTSTHYGGSLISQREEQRIPRKTRAFPIMHSEYWLFHHGCQTAIPITLFSFILCCMSVPVCVQWKKENLVCVCMFPSGWLHMCCWAN